jgi:AcrR family transcriptional regulator
MRTTRTDEEFTDQLHELLKAEGISALSVGQIAARLRCSRRRLYALAPTKEALLHLAAQAHFDRMLQEGFEAGARETDPARAIAAYLRVGVTSTVDLSPAFVRDLEASPEGREIFDRYQLARAEGVRRILEEGIRRGDFTAHNQLVATEVLLGAAFRLRRSEFLAEAGLTLSQAFEEAYALILGGLLAPSRRRRAMARAGAGTRRTPSDAGSGRRRRAQRTPLP